MCLNVKRLEGPLRRVIASILEVGETTFKFDVPYKNERQIFEVPLLDVPEPIRGHIRPGAFMIATMWFPGPTFSNFTRAIEPDPDDGLT